MLLHILLGILIVVAIAMIAVILLQKSEGGGLVSGGGGQLISARGAGNLLTKTTQILGGVFFVLALTITILTGRQSGTDSVTDKLNIQVDPTVLRQQEQQQLQLQQQQQLQQQPGAPAGTTLNPFATPVPATPAPAPATPAQP